MTDYAKGDGALFVNKQKTMDKHPDFRGHITVTPEQVKALIANAKAGSEMKINLASWKRLSKNGVTYMSIETEASSGSGEPKSRPEPQPAPASKPDAFNLDDDIPF